MPQHMDSCATFGGVTSGAGRAEAGSRRRTVGGRTRRGPPGRASPAQMGGQLGRRVVAHPAWHQLPGAPALHRFASVAPSSARPAHRQRHLSPAHQRGPVQPRHPAGRDRVGRAWVGERAQPVPPPQLAELPCGQYATRPPSRRSALGHGQRRSTHTPVISRPRTPPARRWPSSSVSTAPAVGGPPGAAAQAGRSRWW
jgi:hypothetical protein